MHANYDRQIMRTILVTLKGDLEREAAALAPRFGYFFPT
jgi:hypothetical protein